MILRAIIISMMAVFVAPQLFSTNPIVLVSIDGLRPDAIKSSKAVTLLRLMKEGTFYENARTVRPSITLPSHTSMITGLDPSQHGITWNDYVPAYGPVKHKTALEIANDAGLHTAIIVAKDKLLHLNRPNSVDHFELTETSGKDVAAAFENYVATKGLPDVSFLHLPDPDKVGHFLGWMSWFYKRGVKKADRALGRIVDAANNAAGDNVPTFIVTADHGGSFFGHLADIDANNKIPFVIQGEDIPHGQVEPDDIRVYDAAASILSLLNLPIPEQWVGEPVPAIAQ